MVELRKRAQGLVEYGLIIALVAVLAIAGLIIFGPAVSSLLSRAALRRRSFCSLVCVAAMAA